MHSQLKIPFAGLRYYNVASVDDMGYGAYLWSSSPYSASDPHSQRLYLIVEDDLSTEESKRANAYSVRCFYDSYQPYAQSFTLRLHANGGVVAEDTLETDSE